MQYQILSPQTYPVLEVTLVPGEQLVAEAGAMSWMTPEMQVETSTRGGVVSGLKRKVLGGESLFQNTYSTSAESATVGLVPGQPGQIRHLEMDGRELFLERGGYLASTPDVALDTKFQGLKGLFAEGVFALKATGSGLLFFSGYGAVDSIEVDGEYVVDNGYAVAWDSTLDYHITKAKKVRSFLFGDQLLMHFRGHGTLWVQSRSPVSMANWIYPFRTVKKQN